MTACANAQALAARSSAPATTTRSRRVTRTRGHQNSEAAFIAIVDTRLASGAGNKAIGHELSLSANTVSNHIASILSKLQLDNRIQAAVHAVRAGIS